MGKKTQVKKSAVILFNLGGPSSPEEIKPFLVSLFSDPAILRFPNPFRVLLAQGIAYKRLKEARSIYGHLGGKSPLLENTQRQAQALEDALGRETRVFVAMRHASPLTKDTVRAVEAFEPEEIVLLPLYPQYSHTTTGSSFSAWEKATQSIKIPTHRVIDYPENSGFLEALVDLTLPHLKKAQEWGSPRLLLTAHGLPEKFIRGGDPYQRQVEQTARLFVEKLGKPSPDYVLSYQSRVGPLRWIGPSTEEEVVKASQGKQPLVVVPISFVSEHSETLVELDITYRTLALHKGCPAYYRVDTVQTHPAFIKGLAKLVTEAKKRV